MKLPWKTAATQPTMQTVQLPCISHRRCTNRSHKHWTPPGSNTNTDGAARQSKNRSAIKTVTTSSARDSSADNNGKKIEKEIEKVKAGPHPQISTPCSESQKPAATPAPTLAPIQLLPTELILNIVSYVSRVERACLGLTCHSLAIVLGWDTFARASMAHGASWSTHGRMVRMLKRDSSSDVYWVCGDCVRLHLRRRTTTATKQGLGWDLRSWFRAMISERRESEPALRLGVFGNPRPTVDGAIYVLEYALLEAVMDRYFLGKKHGVCLKALNCEGKHRFARTEKSALSLTYSFTPGVVNCKLVLQSNFEFRPLSTTGFWSTIAFLAKINLWICGHENTGKIAETLWLLKEDTFGKVEYFHQRWCRYCPTQCDVTILENGSVTITAYQNLGSGRSRQDANWVHISRTSKWRGKYEWDQPISFRGCEEYMRTPFSTKVQFDFLRRMAQKDGPGSWYDPRFELIKFPMKL